MFILAAIMGSVTGIITLWKAGSLTLGLLSALVVVTVFITGVLS